MIAESQDPAAGDWDCTITQEIPGEIPATNEGTLKLSLVKAVVEFPALVLRLSCETIIFNHSSIFPQVPALPRS
jgi:hypothetical protein